MSYILDALRKAERERQVGQAAALAMQPVVESSRNRLWAGLAFLGLGLNALLVAALLSGQSFSPVRPVAAPAPAPASAVQTSAPISVATASPTPATPRQGPVNTSLSAEPPRSMAAHHRQQPQRPAPPVAKSAVPALEAAPLLDTLPASARRDLPTLNLDIHVHSHDGDKRFVVINGQRYREGESLREGPVLEAVTANGAILRQGQRRFRLSVR